MPLSLDQSLLIKIPVPVQGKTTLKMSLLIEVGIQQQLSVLSVLILEYRTGTRTVLVLQYKYSVQDISYAPRISFLEIRSKFGSILQNRKIYWSYRYYVLKTKSASKTFHSSITLRYFFSFFTCLQYIITRTPIDFKNGRFQTGFQNRKYVEHGFVVALQLRR